MLEITEHFNAVEQIAGAAGLGSGATALVYFRLKAYVNKTVDEKEKDIMNVVEKRLSEKVGVETHVQCSQNQKLRAETDAHNFGLLFEKIEALRIDMNQNIQDLIKIIGGIK